MGLYVYVSVCAKWAHAHIYIYVYAHIHVYINPLISVSGHVYANTGTNVECVYAYTYLLT